MTHRSVYRRLLRLYPASFRREYGESMLQLFCDQLRDETQQDSRVAATQVWRQTLRDLAVSVPRQRIEAFMSKHQTASRLIVAIVAIASAVAALAFAVPTLVLLGVLAAWLASEQARGRLLRLPGQRKWYRWVVGGGAVIAVEFLGITLVRHDFGLTWLAVLGFFVLAVSAVAAGIAMGVRDLRQCRSQMNVA